MPLVVCAALGQSAPPASAQWASGHPPASETAPPAADGAAAADDPGEPGMAGPAAAAAGAARGPVDPIDPAVAEAQQQARDAMSEVYRLEARVRELERERAWDRPGFLLGGGLFYAPENFDFGVGDGNSEGLYWRAAYRFHPMVAADLRFDLLDEFPARGNAARGSVDPLAFTSNVRVYWPLERVQPYFSLGMGVVSARIEGTRFVDGSRFSYRESDFAFRVAGGVDLLVTPSIVINLDLAYLTTGDELSRYPFATLGSGVEFRF